MGVVRDGDSSRSEQDIVSQVFTMIGAGFDTTARFLGTDCAVQNEEISVGLY